MRSSCSRRPKNTARAPPSSAERLTTASISLLSCSILHLIANGRIGADRGGEGVSRRIGKAEDQAVPRTEGRSGIDHHGLKLFRSGKHGFTRRAGGEEASVAEAPDGRAKTSNCDGGRFQRKLAQTSQWRARLQKDDRRPKSGDVTATDPIGFVAGQWKWKQVGVITSTYWPLFSCKVWRDGVRARRHIAGPFSPVPRGEGWDEGPNIKEAPCPATRPVH